MMTQHKTINEGTDNVLVDLGFEDAEELSAKAVLAVKFNDLIDARGLNQTAVAALTGMTQPKVSQVRRYRLQNISLERLMQALVSLDQQVEIIVRPAGRAREARIIVAA
jgi:predicted XRE-type DNA-binding protein